MGALFFSLIEYKAIKEQIFALLILLIAHHTIFTGKSLSMSYVARDVLFIVALFASIKLYHLFIKRNSGIIFYLRGFALVFVYGLFDIAAGLIAFIINTKGNFPPIDFIFYIGRFGVLIGLGLGLGVDFYLQNRKKLFILFKIRDI
jgi:hypothetical protein